MSIKRKQPLVSVIIPTHDRVKLLQRAVLSIQNQQYDNIEVIIVDNKSTKPLEKDLLDFELNIKIFRSEKFMLLPDSRNYGIEKSSGELICFLDDDDEYYTDKIKEGVEFLTSNTEYDFLYGNTVQIDTYGNQIEISSGPIDIYNFLRWRYIHMNSIMIRRHILDHIKFNPLMAIYEDVEFAGRLLLMYKGYHIENNHSIWHRDNRPDQLTKKGNYKRVYNN
ncbi:MAG: glycosyltransferase family A protein, partial [Gammaproteobacteria bacterium]